MKRGAALLLLALPLAAERWNVRYSYDEDRSSLSIGDLQFPAAERGVAAAVITEGEKAKGTALLSGDGGKTWRLVPLKEPPLSLFFVNRTLGWMTTSRGLWKTNDGGERWQKLKAPRNILRVHFLDPQRGFAVGASKAFYSTQDGGLNWTRVAAVDQIKTREEYTHLTWIAFASPKAGLVAGYNRPPRRADQGLPAWVDPDKAESRRELPNLAVTIETNDGGQTWKPSTTSMMGRITRIRFRPTAESVGLVEYSETFDYPSEVFRIDWRTSRMDRVFREKTRWITDVIVSADNTVYIAGSEVAGTLARVPVPGKVHILRSKDYTQWQEMPVDYRVVAQRVVLATSGKDVWAATDTGFLVRLEP